MLRYGGSSLLYEEILDIKFATVWIFLKPMNYDFKMLSFILFVSNDAKTALITQEL